MRRIGGCLAFAVALLARQATAQTRTDERWPLDSGGSVRIMNPFGRVRVLGWDADSLAVSARLERQAGRFFAAGDVHVRKLGVDTAAGGAGADLEVHVPRGATVWVKAATANIDVEGVDGTLDLSSEGGSIRVLGTPQDVTAETMNGSVELAGGTARARVKTVSGDILLRGASQDLGATTLSGRIVGLGAGWVRGGTSGQRGKFEGASGDIRFEGEVGRGGVVELESQSGTIEVRVPASTVADFDLLTIGGRITNELADAQPKQRATGTGQELRVSSGAAGGGAQITAPSLKGPQFL